MRYAAILIALVLAATACFNAPDTSPSSASAPSSAQQQPPVPARTGGPAPWKPPQRTGPRPETTDAPAGTNVAHQQMTQNAPVDLQDALFNRGATLAGVTTGPSRVSVKGARAFFLPRDMARGPRDAFMVSTEFAHIHPSYDGSLHIRLPEPLRGQTLEAGWGEVHPRSASTLMVYGPRDEAELEVVWQLLQASYAYAVGL